MNSGGRSMEETISLQEIFDVLKKRLSLIVVMTIGVAIIAALVSFLLITPMYESNAQFIVNESTKSDQQLSQNDIRTNVELINTYKVIIESQAILDDVVTELNLDMTAAQLANKITVSSAENSQVVNIKAQDEDPSMATQIANTTMFVFQEKLPELMNVDNVHTLSEAIDKTTPISPNKKLNIAIGLVLGLMIGVGIAFLLEYLDTTIRTNDDITKHLEVPILGVISTIEKEDVVRKKPLKRGDGHV